MQAKGFKGGEGRKREETAERKVSLYLFPFSSPLLCTFLLPLDLHLSFTFLVSWYFLLLSAIIPVAFPSFLAGLLQRCDQRFCRMAQPVLKKETCTCRGALIAIAFCHCLVLPFCGRTALPHSPVLGSWDQYQHWDVHTTVLSAWQEGSTVIDTPKHLHFSLCSSILSLSSSSYCLYPVPYIYRSSSAN